MSVSIILVDDHRILREGLRLVPKKESDLCVVVEASNVRDTLQCVRQTQPDVVVMDLHLPDGSGIDAVRGTLAECPQTRIVILSADSGLDQVREALQAGVMGVLVSGYSRDLVKGELVPQGEAAFLAKPFVLADLAEKVRACLDGN